MNWTPEWFEASRWRDGDEFTEEEKAKLFSNVLSDKRFSSRLNVTILAKYFSKEISFGSFLTHLEEIYGDLAESYWEDFDRIEKLSKQVEELQEKLGRLNYEFIRNWSK